MLEHRRHHDALAVEQTAPIEPSTDARRRHAIEKLTLGIERATSEPGYRAALAIFKHLYRYSPGNQIRIFGQDPGATMVNAYDRWQQSGRQVRKGERGIKIYYPQFRHISLENEDGSEERRTMLTGFGEGNVFDIRQTEGPDFELPTPSLQFSTTEGAIEIDKRVSLYGMGQGVIYEQRRLPARMRGYFEIKTNRIVLNDRLPPDDGKLKTLVHETIHAMEHGKQGLAGRDLSEVIAEGGAHAFLGYHGMDTSAYSLPYMVGYTFDREVVRIALPRIAAVTKELITGVEVENPEEAGDWL